jgi:hypothetical protein
MVTIGTPRPGHFGMKGGVDGGESSAALRSVRSVAQ